MEEYLVEKRDRDKKKGEESVNLFIKIMTELGYRCYKATPYQDINEHWDVVTVLDKENDEKIYERFDVKSLKDATIDGRTWVELQNVNGDIGWLYSEFMDTIAFEKEDCFEFVKRIDLIPIVEANIEKEDVIADGKIVYVEKNGLKDYQRYRRLMWGHDDRVVKVPFIDFEHLIYKRIYK